MIPGCKQIIACPLCAHLAQYVTVVAGNLFGAKVWTDGRINAPLIPTPPAVVRCGGCEKYYWLRDANEAGHLGEWTNKPQDTPAEWLAAESVEEPSEAGYLAAITGGLARNAYEEKELRLLTWQRGNDAFRNLPATVTATLSTEARANLEALLPLFGRSAQDQALKGEALRQLGRFDQARKILRRVKGRDYQRAVRQIVSLCDEGTSTLRELDLSEDPGDPFDADQPGWESGGSSRQKPPLSGRPAATMVGMALFGALVAIVWFVRP